MQPVSFSQSMPRIKGLFLGVLLIQFVIALLSGVIFYFGGKSILRYIELLASIAIILFLITITILWFTYLRQPEVKEKYHLKSQIFQNEKDLANTQEAISENKIKKETIQSQSRENQEAEQENYRNLSNRIQDEVKNIVSLKKQELFSELSRIQKAHLENGLKGLQLDPALVPGIGDFLTEKLTANGILTAFDVSQMTIQGISGFGEAKTLSLLRWRESEENKLVLSQPTSLPIDERTIIEQKYDRQFAEKENEAKLAQSTHVSTLQAILSKETSELSVITEVQAASNGKMTALTTQHQELLEQYQQHSKITFLGLLSTALMSRSKRWLNRAAAFIFLVLFFIFGGANMVFLIGALFLSKS